MKVAKTVYWMGPWRAESSADEMVEMLVDSKVFPMVGQMVVLMVSQLAVC